MTRQGPHQVQASGCPVAALVGGAAQTLRAELAAQAAALLDAADGQVLLDTVECFLRANGSPAVVARVLFVHRNTVGYRLARVRRLSGRGVASTADRVHWTLALLALGRSQVLEPL